MMYAPQDYWTTTNQLDCWTGSQSRPARRPTLLHKKLNALIIMAYEVRPWSSEMSHIFNMQTTGNVIEVFGDYNPIYGGKPKKLAMWLLNGAAGRSRFNSRLIASGLAYKLSHVCKRRKTGIRTSLVGLTLLDHWALKFPRFKLFVDAYVTEASRRKIAADSFDLSIGVMPLEWRRAQEFNEKFELEEAMMMRQQAAAQQAASMQQVYGQLIQQQQYQFIQQQMQPQTVQSLQQLVQQQSSLDRNNVYLNSFNAMLGI